MRERPINNAEITKERYWELVWRCRQYDQLIARRSAIRAGFNDLRLNGMPHGTRTSDQTAERAVRALEMSRVIEAIEQAAIAAAPGYYACLLANVTRKVRYEDMPVPCGRRQFYEARRDFFSELDRKLYLGN